MSRSVKTRSAKAFVLGFATAAVMSASVAAQAGVRIDGERRGYDNCLAQAERTHADLITTGHYFINRSASSREYYINALVRFDPDRQPVRIACETTGTGNRLLSLSVAPGRFVPATSVNVIEIVAQ